MMKMDANYAKLVISNENLTILKYVYKIKQIK